MESSVKTRLPLYSLGIIYSSPSLRTALHFGLFFTLITRTIGETVKGIERLRFWRLMPKGERVLAQSKRTAPPHPFHHFKKIRNKLFSIGIFKISIPLGNSISIDIEIFKGGVFQK
jgi:hypothetical protein